MYRFATLLEANVLMKVCWMICFVIHKFHTVLLGASSQVELYVQSRVKIERMRQILATVYLETINSNGFKWKKKVSILQFFFKIKIIVLACQEHKNTTIRSS